MKKFIYNAIVSSIYDGDTLRVDIDCGFNVWLHNEPLRLYGLDAPELRQPEREEGLAARNWLREQIPVGTEILIETLKDKKEKYGRYLAIIYKKDGTNINELMVNLGYAVPYET